MVFSTRPGWSAACEEMRARGSASACIWIALRLRSSWFERQLRGLRPMEWNGWRPQVGTRFHGCGTDSARGAAALSRAYCAEDAAGELNLGFTADDGRETVAGNRRLLAEAITGDSATPLVAVRQIHSNLVRRCERERCGRRERPWKADGLMTDEPGLLLGIQTADCIPVLVADRKRRVVGAFHAGWRGTVKRIVELGVGRMRLEFGSPARGSDCRHRARRRRLLLRGGRRGALGVRVAVSRMRASCFTRSTRRTRCGQNTPCFS